MILFTVSEKTDKKDKKKEEPGSFFQRQRVDLLLGELAKKFPPKFIAPTQPGPEAKGTVFDIISALCAVSFILKLLQKM